jgi:hypothetical protein
MAIDGSPRPRCERADPDVCVEDDGHTRPRANATASETSVSASSSEIREARAFHASQKGAKSALALLLLGTHELDEFCDEVHLFGVETREIHGRCGMIPGRRRLHDPLRLAFSIQRVKRAFGTGQASRSCEPIPRPPVSSSGQPSGQKGRRPGRHFSCRLRRHGNQPPPGTRVEAAEPADRSPGASLT